jgi:hypothetical protein
MSSNRTTGKSRNNRVNRFMANPARPGKAGNAVRGGPGRQIIEDARFRLTDEVRYIQCRAADHDARTVTVGQSVLFSTDTGDAWLFDPSDLFATRLARDGKTEPIHIEETDTAFSIDWKGRYRIDGPVFIFVDWESARVVTILGYPTAKLTQATAALSVASPFT